MKTLILTGDDFGRSPAVNNAILRHHRAGILTQASLMVHEGAAVEAAAMARAHPTLAVGLHLSLCSGRAGSLSALTDASGQFCPSPARAGLRYFFRPSLRAALAAEIRSQFERFLALGLAPSYWDGHTHLHLHPTILTLTLPIAREFGFKAVRLLREPPPRSALGAIFGALSAAAAPKLARAGIAAAGQVCGLHESGRMTAAACLRLLRRLPDGCTEIYFHPGAEPEDLDPVPLLGAIAEENVQLSNWQAFASPAAGS